MMVTREKHCHASFSNSASFGSFIINWKEVNHKIIAFQTGKVNQATASVKMKKSSILHKLRIFYTPLEYVKGSIGVKRIKRKRLYIWDPAVFKAKADQGGNRIHLQFAHGIPALLFYGFLTGIQLGGYFPHRLSGNDEFYHFFFAG